MVSINRNPLPLGMGRFNKRQYGFKPIYSVRFEQSKNFREEVRENGVAEIDTAIG
jgi:hypothetical protein